MAARKIILLYASVVSIWLLAAALIVAQVRGEGPRSLLRVTFLNVGQGDAILIRMPDETAVLVDSGPDASILPELGRALPWWKRSIDFVVLTHSDWDHYGGLFEVAERYPIGTVLTTPQAMANTKYASLLDSLRKRGTVVRYISQGANVQGIDGIDLRVLWPPRDMKAKTTNEVSLALLLSWHAIDFLLMGDVPQEEERSIMKQVPGLTAEVLKVGHHGSKYSSGDAFVSQVQAGFCVISAGKKNHYGHPHIRVVQLLRSLGCRILSTFEVGAIMFATDGRTLTSPSFAL